MWLYLYKPKVGSSLVWSGLVWFEVWDEVWDEVGQLNYEMSFSIPIINNLYHNF